MYGLQAILMAPFSRKYGGLVVMTLRNLSLIFTMGVVPVVLISAFGAWPDAFSALATVWVPMMFAILAGICGLWCTSSAVRYAPVAVTSSVSTVLSVCCMLVLSRIFMSAPITPAMLALIALMLLAGVLLGRQKNAMEHLNPALMGRGLLLATMAGIFGGVSFFSVGSASVVAGPLLAGWLWEGVIGILALLLFCLKNRQFSLPNVPTKDALCIAVYSLPVAMASVAFPLALSLGHRGAVGAINTSMGLAAAAVLGALFLREHLSKRQLLCIGVIVACVVGLRVGV